MRRSLTRPACHGLCRPGPRRQAHHDRLLRVETDPDAFVGLFETAATWAELAHSPDTTIPPQEWLEFAERHRWQDPARMEWIFRLARDIALRAVPAPAPGRWEPDGAGGDGAGVAPLVGPIAARELQQSHVHASSLQQSGFAAIRGARAR